MIEVTDKDKTKIKDKMLSTADCIKSGCFNAKPELEYTIAVIIL
jgi:hypothetical protein